MVRQDVPLDAFLKIALIDIYFKCIDRRWFERFSAKAIDVVRVHSYVFRFALNRMNSDVENELK